jgi:hypothetical protein
MANSLCDSVFHMEIESWKIKQNAQSLPIFPPDIPFFALLAYSDTLRHSLKKPDHRSARKSQPGLLSPSQHSPPQPRATQSETRTSVGRRQSFTVCGYVPLSFFDYHKATVAYLDVVHETILCRAASFTWSNQGH